VEAEAVGHQALGLGDLFILTRSREPVSTSLEIALPPNEQQAPAGAPVSFHQSMIRKSVKRFSEKIMRKQ
jgi:hypothetical protein